MNGESKRSAPETMRRATGREVAAGVLERVFEDDAFAAAALDRHLDAGRLSAEERALATEIVYGVLRTTGALVRRLERFGKIAEDDFVLTSHLLVAAYQLTFLDRVPAHAVVDEAVTSISRAKGSRVGGFANAILRKMASLGREEPLSLTEAVLASTPSWLRKRLVRQVGEAEALGLLLPEARRGAGIRLRPGRSLPSDDGAAFEGVPICPGAHRFVGRGDPRRFAGYGAGDYVVQELGAQILGRLVMPQAGERVLDVCAGRGQKTSHLADLAPEADIVATELFPQKLEALGREMERLGLSVERRAHDFTQPLPRELIGCFDVVLVDAPCTGVGTLRRRPEILRRLRPEDPGRMGELQARIVRTALDALAPGGRLVFATCSVLSDEGEGVIERLGDAVVPRLLPPLTPGSAAESRYRLLPLQHGTDGYFVAGLERRA